MPRFVIVVDQLVTDEQLLRSDDRLHNPKGAYIVEDVAHEEMALDVFHALIPIGCLDDFSISVSPLLATLNPDLVERQKQSDIDRKNMFSIPDPNVEASSPEFPSIFDGLEQNLGEYKSSKTTPQPKKQMEGFGSAPEWLMPPNGPHPTQPYGLFTPQQMGYGPCGYDPNVVIEPRTGKKWTIGKGVLELEGTQFLITHVAESNAPFQASWKGSRIPNGDVTTLSEAKAAVGQYLVDLIAIGLES